MRVSYNCLNMRNRTIKLIKKKSFKFLSTILIISLVSTTIFFKNVRSMATTPDKPGFTISDISFDPSEPKAGEDITVSGKINPTDFEIPVPQKEIVLVLDVSGSMEDEVTTECTNSRVDYKVSSSDVYPNKGRKKYTKINNTQFQVTKINGDYYIKDYCEEHNKVGEHNSTKITELKKAANSFVDRMKQVPNLKIGIVAYSSKAWMNPNGKNGNESTESIDFNNSHEVPKYQSVGSDLLDITDSRLPNMINNLEALGGTNTGEGLRKAAYMLRNENTTSKTIVLMSDGLPTFYSVKGNNDKNYYTTIDDTNPYYAGSGSDDDSNEDCLKYAKTIGGLIDDKGYNVFSIGYGLDDSGNKKLKQIHESMGGTLPVDNQEDDQKTYFETDNGAIDNVFQNIATQIISNYDIKGGILTSKMLDPFGLALGGETVSIPDIHYKKDDANSTPSKIRYHAEPYTFTFKIKASKAGDYSNIFKDSYISFPWNNETISCIMPVCNINVVDNTLPIINAEVVNPPNEAKVSEDIPLEYKIEPQKFKFQSTVSDDSVAKDIVFALDISKSDQNDNGNSSWNYEDDKVERVQKALIDNLTNNLEIKNGRFGIVTYSNKVYDTYTLMDPQELAGEIAHLSETVSGASKVSEGEEAAKAILEKDGRDNSKRYVVIISSGHGSAKHEIENDVSNGAYNRITLNLDNIDSDSLSEIEDTEIPYIFDQIKNATDQIPVSSYTFKAKLKFHTGEKFDIVSGLNASSDPWYDAETQEFEVKYNLDENGEYIPEEIPNVKITIEANSTGDNLEFGDSKNENRSENKFSGAISYENLVGELTYNRITPFSIKVSSAIEILEHGIYEGIKDHLPSIDDRSTFDLVKGTNVRLGATLYGSINNQSDDIKLKIPKELEIKDPIVYTYDNSENSTGELTRVGILYSPDNGEKIYKYKSDNGSSITDKNILILYNEIPQNDGIYTNHLYGQNAPDEPVTINVGDELPDLF